MKLYNLYLCLMVSLLTISCTKDESGYLDDYNAQTPGSIMNVTSEPRPGMIFLQWEKEGNSMYDYVRVSYFDPRTETEMYRNASKYADSILIPNTLQKLGEYKFKLQPFNRNGEGGKVVDFTAVSGRALSDTVYVQKEITLTPANLASNAPETSEGSLANTLDGNEATYFHSSWSNPGVADIHNFQVNLDTPVQQAFKFTYGTRNNGNNWPREIVIEGSTGDDNWEAIQTISSGLPEPSNAFARYTSDVILINKPYKKIRFNVTKTKDGRKWFVFSEFGMWDIELQINDPEA